MTTMHGRGVMMTMMIYATSQAYNNLRKRNLKTVMLVEMKRLMNQLQL
jgi:hypothetical protein